MEPDLAVVWIAGAIYCVVIQHWDAQTYESQVLEGDRVILQRMFVTVEDAAHYASDCAFAFGVVLGH